MSILYRSAFELAVDIKAQRLSSVEVLAFFLGRIAQHNGSINAVVALDEARAQRQALAADAAAAAGEDWGPLHGVPITIKDAFCTEGLTTVGGIPECRNHVPQENAVAVQRYIDAGAIIFGKTNVPFMSSDLQSYNDIYGTTNNPWDHARTCGGSSGGAAAALAAGLTPLELGSDIGGSIRTPCHFNGVYGHKPSFGIVSQRGHLPPGTGVLSESDLSVVGPLATNVGDLEKALDVLAGPGPEDTAAWQLHLPQASFTAVGELRVAVWSDDVFCPVDSEIVSAVEATGAMLSKMGAQVDYSARPDVDATANHYNYTQLLMAAMGGGMPDAVYESAREAVAAAAPDDMSEPVLQMRGIAMSHRDWLKNHERRLRARAAWAQFFENFDVLLCPCAHVPAFPHDHTPSMGDRTLQVNDEAQPYTRILRWAGLTLNAYLPVTAVPVGRTKGELPIGLQVVAPFLGDKTALAVARLIEQSQAQFKGPDQYSE